MMCGDMERHPARADMMPETRNLHNKTLKMAVRVNSSCGIVMFKPWRQISKDMKK